MRLLISDATILIDMDVAGLLAPMFSLGHRYGVPDVLYYEELEDQHSHLLDYGLEIMRVDAKAVTEIEVLAKKYRHCSLNDLFALSLAEHENCTLLTGDKNLRAAAEVKSIEVHGTVWLILEMVESGKLELQVAVSAIQRMKVAGRWLPWSMLEEELRKISNNS